MGKYNVIISRCPCCNTEITIRYDTLDPESVFFVASDAEIEEAMREMGLEFGRKEDEQNVRKHDNCEQTN